MAPVSTSTFGAKAISSLPVAAPIRLIAAKANMAAVIIAYFMNMSFPSGSGERQEARR